MDPARGQAVASAPAAARCQAAGANSSVSGAHACSLVLSLSLFPSSHQCGSLNWPAAVALPVTAAGGFSLPR